jgi:hypothetical protein
LAQRRRAPQRHGRRVGHQPFDWPRFSEVLPPAVAEQLTRKLKEPGDDQQKYENEHAPNTWRRDDMARLGVRAMIGGLLASYLTATIAGILL